MSDRLFGISKLTQTFFLTRWYWIWLAAIGLFMEGTALYYQYILGDEPCQICIHVRVWVAAFIILALIMAVLPPRRSLYVGGHAVNTVIMLCLWERSKLLFDLENGKGDGSCQFMLGFPDWFALDKWFPAMFEVRNLCGMTPEMWGGFSMAEMLVFVSIMMVFISMFALYLNFKKEGLEQRSAQASS